MRDATLPQEAASTQTVRQAAPERIATGVSFQVVDEKVYDIPIKTQVEQHVVANGIPNQEELKAEILRRYNLAKSRTGFRYHRVPTNIYIYVYGTKEQALAGQGLWIGMLAKSYGDSGTPKVEINTDRLAALSAPAQEQFGLSEAKQKRLFHDLAAAEDRAMREAMARVPANEIMRQIKLQQELDEKYKNEVTKRYGVTNDQALKISVKGIKNGWLQ